MGFKTGLSRSIIPRLVIRGVILFYSQDESNALMKFFEEFDEWKINDYKA